MAATIGLRKGVIYCPRVSLLATSQLTKKFQASNRCELHTSQPYQIDRRKDKAIAIHLRYRNHEKSMKHRHLPINNTPDYSYCDGRHTEISICQKLRQEKNYQLVKQIVQLVGEVKMAQEQLKAQINEQSIKNQTQLASRLKEKNTPI